MSIALIDGNNFYASCEEALNPSLIGRPLIILSNNDGCVIARNAEARRLGISMGTPYFKVRHSLKRWDIEVRSSNYALYGDMSQRLMSLIETDCEELEIYSIDEAFVKIDRPKEKSLQTWARQLRARIYQNLGLPIAIGIGKNKSQAKLANHLAKTIINHAGVLDLEAIKEQGIYLEKVAIEDVWGVGKKLAQLFQEKGIKNARQLRDMPSNELNVLYGIVGIRLQSELKGITCLPLSNKHKPKKETCVSRSFSKPITRLEDLRQAIATYAVRASKKLREQEQYAGSITVFTRTSPYRSNFYSQSATKVLNLHSNDTSIILQNSLELTNRIFKPNRLLIKAGVIMKDLIINDHLQLHLLETQDPNESLKRERLMHVIDNLNQRYGADAIKWAACGDNPNGRMDRKYLSLASTTRLQDIPIVKS